jgi:hypothetical protein
MTVSRGQRMHFLIELMSRRPKPLQKFQVTTHCSTACIFFNQPNWARRSENFTRCKDVVVAVHDVHIFP